MRNLVLLLPLLAGCNADLCSLLLGTFQGAYEGDLAGSLEAVLTADPDDDSQALADFTLGTADSSIGGTGHVSCESGSLVVDLRDIDGLNLGQILGNVDGKSADGSYAMESGEEGTWAY